MSATLLILCQEELHFLTIVLFKHAPTGFLSLFYFYTTAFRQWTVFCFHDRKRLLNQSSSRPSIDFSLIVK